MNKLFDLINSKEMNTAIDAGWAIIIPLWIFLIIYGQDIKAWRIKQFQEQKQKQSEPPLIVCASCKGKGEKPTDVNKLMMDAKLALFINHHLNVDKCKKCVKLPHGDTYDYCETVQDRYQILLQEYGAAGPKIQMADCDKCMGAGEFTIRNPDGSYVTQKEYDEEHKKN